MKDRRIQFIMLGLICGMVSTAILIVIGVIVGLLMEHKPSRQQDYVVEAIAPITHDRVAVTAPMTYDECQTALRSEYSYSKGYVASCVRTG